MKIRTPDKNIKRTFALIYGETGVGKTVSTLLTAPRPMLYFECEPRPVERTAEEIDMTDIKIAHPEDFFDLFEFLQENQKKIVSKYKTIFIDSLSFLMNVTLLGEIEEETARAEIFDTKKRPIVSLGRTDWTGYGALGSLMKRFCALLGKTAVEGSIVICSALLDDKPKWNRELSAAPAFAGKDFPRDMPSYFDIIGLVEERKDKEGNVIYPPVIKVKSDGSFLAKWTGKPLKGSYGELDWRKILNLVE
jgi:hypothetical protein